MDLRIRLLINLIQDNGAWDFALNSSEALTEFIESYGEYVQVINTPKEKARHSRLVARTRRLKFAIDSFINAEAKDNPKAETDMTHNTRLKALEYLQSLMVLECTDFDVWFYFASQLKQDCAESNDVELYNKVEKYIQERLRTREE